MKNIQGNFGLNQKGISLIEVMVAVLLMNIGIISSLMYFSSASASTRLARDIMVATNHAEYILEEMRAKSTLDDIKNEDWDAFISAEGLNSLTDEAITIAYADVDADPLNITVTVNWETNLRDRNVAFVTEMTK